MSVPRSAAINTLTFDTKMKIIAERAGNAPDAEAGPTTQTQPLLTHDSSPEAVFARLSVSASALMHNSHEKPSTRELTAAADSLRKNTFLSDLHALKELVAAQWASFLLVCIPLGIVASTYNWGPVPVFLLNFVALIPLAMLLGDVTEDLSLRMGSIAGGLLNATFGNVTEVVLSMAALRKGLLDVVAMSLLGSILSNLLLVLGCCFLVGGMYHHMQNFNGTSSKACLALLFLSATSIAIPTSSAHLIVDPDSHDTWVLNISRWTAILMVICYLSYLVFTLHSHRDLFDEEEGEDGGEEEVPVLSVTGGVAALSVISVFVAVHSEYLTGAIEGASAATGITQGFLAIIVLPIAGNACEHLAAVMMAARNKMDLSLGIAIGSSLQIALFAIPLCVLAGWVIGQPMALDYDPFSVLALLLAVVHTALITLDSRSHWIMGVELIIVYSLIAIVFWWRPDENKLPGAQ